MTNGESGICNLFNRTNSNDHSFDSISVIISSGSSLWAFPMGSKAFISYLHMLSYVKSRFY
jgi:hypothetical protein